MFSSTHTWVFNDQHTHHTLDLQAGDRVVLTGGQRCSQTATVQTGVALSVCMCVLGCKSVLLLLQESSTGQKMGMCLWSSEAQPELSSCTAAPLCLQMWPQRLFLVWIEINIMSLHSVLFSSLPSVLLCCPLLIVYAAHSANEPVQAQSAFYERDSQIFTGDIKPHITTAQMEQKHMTDRPRSGRQKKKKSMRTVCVKQPVFLPTITLFLSSLVHLCPSSN